MAHTAHTRSELGVNWAAMKLPSVQSVGAWQAVCPGVAVKPVVHAPHTVSCMPTHCVEMYSFSWHTEHTVHVASCVGVHGVPTTGCAPLHVEQGVHAAALTVLE